MGNFQGAGGWVTTITEDLGYFRVERLRLGVYGDKNDCMKEGV